MKCPEQAVLVEIACARALSETLSPELQAAARHAAQCQTCAGAINACVAVAREALAAGTPDQAGPCPGDETIAAYLDNTLSPDARARAETHFAACGSCLAQLVELHAVLSETPQPPALQFICELAHGALRMLAHPAEGFTLHHASPVPVLGVRGEASPPPQKVLTWSQAAGGLRLFFSAVPVDESHVDLVLKVKRELSPVPGTRVTLREDRSIVQSEELSSDGAVTLRHLEPGAYRTDIVLPDGEIVPFEISFRPAG